MVDCVCLNKACGKPFQARATDVKRGWGRYCCNTCKNKGVKARHAENFTRKTMTYIDSRDDAMMGATEGWDEGGWLN